MESTKTPEIHADLVRQVILNFLQIRLNEKLKKEENNLAKALFISLSLVFLNTKSKSISLKSEAFLSNCF